METFSFSSRPLYELASWCNFLLLVEVVVNVFGKFELPFFPESSGVPWRIVFGFGLFCNFLPSGFSHLEASVGPPWLVDTGPKAIWIASSFSPDLLGIFNVGWVEQNWSIKRNIWRTLWIIRVKAQDVTIIHSSNLLSFISVHSGSCQNGCSIRCSHRGIKGFSLLLAKNNRIPEAFSIPRWIYYIDLNFLLDLNLFAFFISLHDSDGFIFLFWLNFKSDTLPEAFGVHGSARDVTIFQVPFGAPSNEIIEARFGIKWTGKLDISSIFFLHVGPTSSCEKRWFNWFSSLFLFIGIISDEVVKSFPCKNWSFPFLSLWSLSIFPSELLNAFPCVKRLTRFGV